MIAITHQAPRTFLFQKVEKFFVHNLHITNDILDLNFGTLHHLILETLEALKNLQEKLGFAVLKIALVVYVLITSITFGMSVSHILVPPIQRCSGK